MISVTLSRRDYVVEQIPCVHGRRKLQPDSAEGSTRKRTKRESLRGGATTVRLTVQRYVPRGIGCLHPRQMRWQRPQRDWSGGADFKSLRAPTSKGPEPASHRDVAVAAAQLAGLYFE